MEREIRDSAFYSALRDFSGPFIKVLRDAFKDDKLRKRYLIGSDRHDTAKRLLEGLEEIGKNHLILGVSEAIENNEVIRKHFSHSVGTRIYGEPNLSHLGFLAYFIATYIHSKYAFDFEEEYFRNIYVELEDYYYSGLIKHRVVAPIGNFSCSKLIDLGNGLTISKTPLQGWNIPRYSNSIIFEYSSKKVFRPERYLPHEELDKSPLRDVILALRLFKPDLIYYNAVAFERILPIYDGHYITYSRKFEMPTKRASYIFKTTEIEKFKRMWQDLNNKTNKVIKIRGIPMQRFGQAIERVTSEDQLLDYSIGLESLLSKGNEGEMTFKIAMRGAIILGRGPKSRNKIFHELREIYTMRSKIVHGSEHIDKKELEDLIEKSFSYLKRLILIFLYRKERSLNAYLELIDKSIFLQRKQDASI